MLALHFLAVIALAGSFPLSSAARDQADPGTPASDVSNPGTAVNAYFERAEAYGFNGAVLIARGDDVLLREGYGLADQIASVSVSPSTVFSVGSVTKQFTAAGILKLMEEGKLSLEDPISRHLPDIPPDKAAITIAQLLAHTSGLPNTYPDSYPKLSPQEYLEEVLTTKELLSTPGSQYRYSNLGYYLLGELIEAVSGNGWEQFLGDAFFKPLKMTQTGFHLPSWNEKDLAHYEDLRVNDSWSWIPRDEIVVPVQRPHYLSADGSGGMLSTLDDLFRWHQALSSGEVLAPESIERMYIRGPGGYGFGWRIGESPLGGRRVWHGGYDTDLGTVAYFDRHLDADLVVIVLASSNVSRTLDSETIENTLQTLVFGGEMAVPPATVAPTEATIWPVGKWQLPGGETVTVEQRGSITEISTDTPQASLAFAYPQSAATDPRAVDFRMEAVLAGLESDDLQPLADVLWEQVNVEEVSAQVAGMFKFLQSNFGPLVEMRSLLDVWNSKYREVWRFVLLRFENGFRVLRLLENAQGRLLFRDEPIPDAISIRLAHHQPGLFSFWNFRSGRASWLRFDSESDRLYLVQEDATIPLIRLKDS